MTGVIIFVVGCLLVVGNFGFGVPPGKGIGILSAVVGAIFFGLSFVPWPDVDPKAPDPFPPFERVGKVFYEPEPVFKNLRFYPRWLVAFLIIALMSSIYMIAYRQRLGREKMASDVVERKIAGGWVPEDKMALARSAAIDAAEKEGVVDDIVAPLSTMQIVLLFMLVLACLYLLAVVAFGGRMNFWQALCVASYSSLPIVVIGMGLNLMLLYVKPVEDLETMRVQRGLARADLGLLFSSASPDNPLLLEHPYLYTIGSFLGIFTIYGWWLSAVGLRHAGEKLSSASAWTIVFLIWFLGLLLTLLFAVLGPSFVG